MAGALALVLLLVAFCILVLGLEKVILYANAHSWLYGIVPLLAGAYIIKRWVIPQLKQQAQYAKKVYAHSIRPSLTSRPSTTQYWQDLYHAYHEERVGKPVMYRAIVEHMIDWWAKLHAKYPDAAVYEPDQYAAQVKSIANNISRFTDEKPALHDKPFTPSLFYQHYSVGPFFSDPEFALYMDQLQLSVPIPIPESTWYRSAWICAPSGKGKTNLLHNLVAYLRPKGTVILMDFKTDLVSPYYSQAEIIEPSLEHPPQINPLDLGSSIQATELLEYLFSSLLEAKMTPKQSALFAGMIPLLSVIPGATLETMRELLQHGWKKYENYVAKLPPRQRDFFSKQGFDSQGYSATKEEVLWRLQLLFRYPHMAAMLESPKTELHVDRLMDSGKVVVIDTNPLVLGELGAEFFGRLMVALVWNAVIARSRQHGHKTPVYFIIDECQNIIYRDEKVPKLIDQCRAQNVSLIFAHQRFDQIKSDDVKSALTNCAIKLAAPDADKPALASRFGVEPEFFNLPQYHFALSVQNQATVAVSVPHLPLKATQKPNKPPMPRPAPPPPPEPEPHLHAAEPEQAPYEAPGQERPEPPKREPPKEPPKDPPRRKKQW